MSVPPCPPEFAFDKAPVGVEVRFVEFLAQRPVMKEHPRAILAHTNGASVESSLQGMWNHAHRDPNTNTIPHYGVDRQGRAWKMLPSNVRGIANSTVLPGHKDWPKLTDAERAAISEHPVRSAEWSLAIETADTGYLADPGISDFTPAQAETVATIVSYESIVCGFPIDIPDRWWGAGVCSHTDPFPYPFHTIAKGKICPGAKKKASVRNLIIPRARQIAAAWTAIPDPAPVPPSTLEDDPMFIARDVTTGKMWLGNLISKVQVDDVTAQHRIAFAQRAGRPILNTDGKPVLWEHKLSTVLAVSDAQIRALGGAPV